MPASQNSDVWVMIPAYNEGAVIYDVLQHVLSLFPNVVVVDDGSQDDTVDQVLATSARLVRHPMNMGAGGARQTGFEFALRDPDAQFFITFDADGQHRPEDAVAMIQHMRTHPVDILLGSRFMGQDATSMPASKRLLLKAARIFERLQSGVTLTDAHNGLRVFRRNFAEQIKLTSTDMAYASELLEAIGRSGLVYGEFPITVDYTEHSLAKGQRSINSVNIAADVMVNKILKGR